MRPSAYFVITLLVAHPVCGSDGTYEKDIRPLLDTRCLACHAGADPDGGVRLDRTTGARVEERVLWTHVWERVRDGEMPPEDAEQLTDAERKRLLSWIESNARNLRRERGAATTRRLNRRELGAALRDVTGATVDFAIALPGDGKIDGFDTGAAGLQDAADSVARMLEVTRRAVDGIRFLEPPRGEPFTADLRNVKDPRKALDIWKDRGATSKIRGFANPGVGVMLEPKWLGERSDQSIFVPPPPNAHGVLRLRLTVAAVKPFPGVPNPHLAVEVAGRVLEYAEITSDPGSPQVLEYEVQLDDLAIGGKGIEIELANRVELPYAIDGFENEVKSKDPIPGGAGVFRPKYDRKKTPWEQRPVPFVVLQDITIDPDATHTWPPASWGADVGEITDNAASAERLLSLWMDRAWRRPVAAAERKRFTAFYTRLRKDGLTFDAALRSTFQSVLLSGPFRYLASPADSEPQRAQHALASRLSFMLIGAPPDADLRAMAAVGRLRDAKVLDAQVARLLDDPRSDAFFRPFVVQWLEMEQPITLVMDHFQQQDFRFGRYLKASMREETIQYVATLFRENRPVRELIDSDWTLMNDALAVHYGYDVDGGELRKVKLRRDDPRGGGVLGHAGIQSMLCWMGENWVVYRGAWTLRHVLDDPPPPPPLEVPELEPSAGGNRGKSFKELLVQHQSEAKCAVCHRKMDPLGFAFQNFDLSGRWRDVEHEKYVRNELDGKIEWRGEGRTRPVDAVGKLPRGEPFTTYDEFKQGVVEHYLPDVAGGLTKRLFLYGSGRRPDVPDTIELRELLANEAKRGHRLRDLLQALIRSKAFRDELH